VQCVVTSPPYWGLRDYSLEPQVWGGDAGCEHEWQDGKRPGMTGGPSAKQESNAGSWHNEHVHAICQLCGAWRGQLGLEPTPELYVQHIVEIMREVRRVLRDDGTVWLNLGDSYVGANNTAVGGNENFGSQPGREGIGSTPKAAWRGLPAKNLCGIPWRCAFALQADGWVLRQEIIFSKKNPMPESVQDRCTRAHEQIFMLTKAKWTGKEPFLGLSTPDAMWLAAIIDGEGSICFQDRKSRGASRSTYSVRLSISNSSQAILERVVAICGMGGLGTPSPRWREDGTNRPVYGWQVTNKKAATVIAAIRPYLIAKTQQADLALFVHRLNQKHKGSGGYKTTEKDDRLKAQAAEACSALNRGKQPDLSWFRPPRLGRWRPFPYAYDADAIREEAIHAGAVVKASAPGAKNTESRGVGDAPGGAMRTAWGFSQHDTVVGDGRNKRSVWHVATEPFPEAHFAVFPTKLVEPCVLAGTSAGGQCPECGAPRERVIERLGSYEEQPGRVKRASGVTMRNDADVHGGRVGDGRPRGAESWQPTCDCGVNETVDQRFGHPGWEPQLVLDPFCGSGTVGVVALRHGRRFIGIDANPEYCEMARNRIDQDCPLFNRPTEQ
jgi:DNA modification methylase